MAKVKGNPWKYAGGGAVDDEDDEADDTGQKPAFPVDGSAMQALAAQLAAEGQTAGAPADEAPARVPATAKDNVVDLRAQLQKFLSKQAGGADNMQKLAEMYGKKLGQDNDRTDLSPLLALSDSLYGTKLGAVYKKPLNADEQLAEQMRAQAAVDKSNAAVTGAADKEYGQDNNAVAKEQANYYRGLAGNQKDIAKATKQEQQLTDRMHDDMFFKRGTNPQVSQSLNKLQRATSSIALMDKLQGGVTPGEMSNIASSLGGLASGGNMVTNEKMREILPSNVALTASGIAQWFSSEPQGAEQQAWLQRFRREIDGETRAARNTLSNYQNAQADSYYGRIPDAVHQRQLEAGQRFLQHSYYDPDKPSDYLGQVPKTVTDSAAGKPTATPPVPGAIPKMKAKSKQKVWLHPDGTTSPRE